ncbi:hypothetical protein OSTOST_22669 [Ostertagia ostertagi]
MYSIRRSFWIVSDGEKFEDKIYRGQGRVLKGLFHDVSLMSKFSVAMNAGKAAIDIKATRQYISVVVLDWNQPCGYGFTSKFSRMVNVVVGSNNGDCETASFMLQPILQPSV